MEFIWLFQTSCWLTFVSSDYRLLVSAALPAEIARMQMSTQLFDEADELEGLSFMDQMFRTHTANWNVRLERQTMTLLPKTLPTRTLEVYWLEPLEAYQLEDNQLDPIGVNRAHCGLIKRNAIWIKFHLLWPRWDRSPSKFRIVWSPARRRSKVATVMSFPVFELKGEGKLETQHLFLIALQGALGEVVRDGCLRAVFAWEMVVLVMLEACWRLDGRRRWS